MSDLAKTFIGGIVVIGLVTAFGLHASGLNQVIRGGGAAGSRLLGTAEKG